MLFSTDYNKYHFTNQVVGNIYARIKEDVAALVPAGTQRDLVIKAGVNAGMKAIQDLMLVAHIDTEQLNYVIAQGLADADCHAHGKNVFDYAKHTVECYGNTNASSGYAKPLPGSFVMPETDLEKLQRLMDTDPSTLPLDEQETYAKDLLSSFTSVLRVHRGV